MTIEDFVQKYVYGIGNDALTDNQEAIDMRCDLLKLIESNNHTVLCDNSRSRKIKSVTVIDSNCNIMGFKSNE